jgi:hypothetical protein
MAYTYTHTKNPESPSGYTTKITDSNGLWIETSSVIYNTEIFKGDYNWGLVGEIDEMLTERKALKAYHETIGSVNSQMERVKTINTSQVMDTTYMGGSSARVDYAVGTTQGQAIVTKLEATWPDEVASYDNNNQNLVSEYTAARPPYDNNPCISFYNFDEPTNTIKTAFNATYEEYKSWYGLKFDTVTETVLAKFVIPDEEMKNADIDTWQEIHDLLPVCSYTFFARIHDKDENIDENVDVYFQADAIVMQEWCTANSYTFPYDTDDDTIEPILFIWGCVYNTTSKEITHVKAYTRTTV